MKNFLPPKFKVICEEKQTGAQPDLQGKFMKLYLKFLRPYGRLYAY